MKTVAPIVSIVRKDLAVHRMELVAWFAMLSLLVCVAALVSGGGLSRFAETARFSLGVASFGCAAVVYILTLSVLREDPASDGSAFWVTRPIAPWQMLAAKCAGVVLIAWLPVLLVALPWCLYLGFRDWSLLRCLGSVVGGCVAYSSFACSAAFFVKRNTSLPLVLIAHCAVLLLFLLTLARLTPKALSVGAGGVWPAVLGATGLAWLTAFAHHRLTRKRWPGLALVGASAVLLACAARFPSGWGGGVYFSKPGGAALERVRCAPLDYAEVGGKVPFAGRGRGRCLISGLGAGEYLATEAGRLDVIQPGGARLMAHFTGRAARAAADAAALSGSLGNEDGQSVGFEVFAPSTGSTPVDAARRLPAHPRLLSLRAPVMRVEKEVELALVEKTRGRTSDAVVIVEEVRRSEAGRVSVRIHSLEVAAGSEARPAYYLTDDSGGNRTAPLPSKARTNLYLLGVRLVWDTLNFDVSTLDLPPASASPDNGPSIEWLRLARTQARFVGEIERAFSPPLTAAIREEP